MLRYITPFLLLLSCGCLGHVDVLVLPSTRFRVADPIRGLQIAHDGQRLVTTSWAGSIALWDTSSQKVSWERRFSEGRPTDVALSEDGQQIFAVWSCPVVNRSQYKVRILDTDEGDVAASYCLGEGERIAAISPTAGLGYVVDKDSCGFVDLSTGQKVAKDLQLRKLPYCTFSSDGKVAALWGGEDEILVVRLNEKLVTSIHVSRANVVAVADDSVFVRDTKWNIWCYSTTAGSKGRRVVQGVRAFALVPARRLYACLDKDGRLWVGSLDGEFTQQCARVMGPYWYYSWDVAASADGLLAIAGSSCTTYPIPRPYLGCVQYSPVGAED